MQLFFYTFVWLTANLSPSTAYKFRLVTGITILWVLAGVLVELLYAVNYNPALRQFEFYFIFGHNAGQHLLITAIGPLAGGLLGGSFIVFYQREKLKGKTYGQKLLLHSAIYILYVCVCILIVGSIASLSAPSGTGFAEKFKSAVFNLRVLRLLVTWYIIVILTIFFLDVSEKYGRGVLKRLLLGKYHHPLQEERVFLFLDLKSSTSIAEQIGDIAYFRMLKVFFQLATEAILNTRGEIYQYVGDEIIISWKTEEGYSRVNCLHCFSDIRRAIRANENRFREQFGVVPDFKAAIHAGRVTTGEIGVIKKEIVYSGDILNTTARIMSLCNQYGASLLVSEIIYRRLDGAKGYRFTWIDSPALRGKEQSTALYRVEEA